MQPGFGLVFLDFNMDGLSLIEGHSGRFLPQGLWHDLGERGADQNFEQHLAATCHRSSVEHDLL